MPGQSGGRVGAISLTDHGDHLKCQDVKTERQPDWASSLKSRRVGALYRAGRPEAVSAWKGGRREQRLNQLLANS